MAHREKKTKSNVINRMLNIFISNGMLPSHKEKWNNVSCIKMNETEKN